MADLLIHDISEAMQRDIAARAERNGTSLSDEAKVLLDKALLLWTVPANGEDRSAWDVLRPILRDDGDEFAQLMDEIEAERKKDFGRPVEDFE